MEWLSSNGAEVVLSGPIEDAHAEGPLSEEKACDIARAFAERVSLLEGTFQDRLTAFLRQRHTFAEHELFGFATLLAKIEKEEKAKKAKKSRRKPRPFVPQIDAKLKTLLNRSRKLNATEVEDNAIAFDAAVEHLRTLNLIKEGDEPVASGGASSPSDPPTHLAPSGSDADDDDEPADDGPPDAPEIVVERGVVKLRGTILTRIPGRAVLIDFGISHLLGVFRKPLSVPIFTATRLQQGGDVTADAKDDAEAAVYTFGGVAFGDSRCFPKVVRPESVIAQTENRTSWLQGRADGVVVELVRRSVEASRPFPDFDATEAVKQSRQSERFGGPGVGGRSEKSAGARTTSLHAGVRERTAPQLPAHTGAGVAVGD